MRPLLDNSSNPTALRALLPTPPQTRRPDKPRWITPEPLNVAPALVGLPLAQPGRRALAMGLDLMLLALLSGVSGFWLLGGLALVVVQLRSQRGGTTRKRLVVGWLGAGVLALLAFQEARTDWTAGGLGFAQMLWDPNCQGLQDKAAHTAVVDLRAPRTAQANESSDG